MRAETGGWRPFTGALRRHPLRFWPLAKAGIRTAAWRRRVLLLLFAMPAIWTIVFAFQVYLRYALETGEEAAVPLGTNPMYARFAARGIADVRQQIDAFFNISRFFAIVVVGWFGAGLLCDDRRLGAHLLYFSRPLTRLDYLLARFTTLVFFGACATLFPGLVICVVAAWSSPDWSFVREDGGVILGTLGFGALLCVVMSLLTLAVSSLATRKSFALLGIFALLVVPDVLARILDRLLRDPDWRMVSIVTTLRRIGAAMLGREGWYAWPVGDSLLIVAGLVLASVVVLALRSRKWESVG